MTDSSLYSADPEVVFAFPSANGTLADTGAIGRRCASPAANEFLLNWLSAATGRDPVLAYHEAVTLAGMLELLTCEEARAWLLPALTAALAQDPSMGFAAALEIAEALKPAAMALRGGRDDDMALRLPEPANSRGPSTDRR